MSIEGKRPKIREWVSDHREDCIEFLRELIAIPSASTVGEDEAEIARRIESEMESLGYDETFVDGIGNVHGVIEGEGSEEGAVLFNSHVDTVGAGDSDRWEHDPYAADVVGGTLYGLGASDMKCATAAMVYGGGALAALDDPPARDAYVTGEVMEEVHEGHAMRYVDEELDVDLAAVVIGEASEMNVKRGHRGRCELAVTLEGASCHASAPVRGVNPLYHAAAVLQRIEELNRETADDDFLGSGTIAATDLEVKTPSNNAVPARATIYVDRRLTIGEDEATAHVELEDAVDAARASYGDAVDATVETLTFDDSSYTGYREKTPKYYPTWVLDADHPLVADTKRTVDEMLGGDAEVGQWTFSTSGTYTMGVAEIPTVGFGPSRETYAHTTRDQVEVDDVVEAAAVYAALGLEL